MGTDFGDAQNSAVRAFLFHVTKVLKSKSKESIPMAFNGKESKEKWENIKKDFDDRCAYCGDKPEKLTKEHLIMKNRKQGGLDFFGNIVPCCSPCNHKHKKETDSTDWTERLKNRLSEKDGLNEHELRLKRIKEYIKKENYPLSPEDNKKIQEEAEHLYIEIREVIEKYLKVFKEKK